MTATGTMIAWKCIIAKQKSREEDVDEEEEALSILKTSAGQDELTRRRLKQEKERTDRQVRRTRSLSSLKAAEEED